MKVLLGITGGIAACKSVLLASKLTEAGFEVQTVLTTAALEFVTPISLQALTGNPVRTELFDPLAENSMSHIELARVADVLLIAPASANFIAKMAHGIADDLLSTIYLATKARVLLCPAMNMHMWQHPAVQENCAKLRQRGVEIIGPALGRQACGDYGPGRMVEIEDIMQALQLQHLAGLLRGQRVLITAGPTREALDPVRYLSNHSSGKMGYALAAAAHAAGAAVTLITGPVVLPPPHGVNVISIESAQEMYTAVHDNLTDGAIFIGAAAVADYTVSKQEQKMVKTDKFSIKLTLNPDILSSVAAAGRASYVAGFAAQTHDIEQYAYKKLLAKGADMMIANEVGDKLGFNVDNNQVTIITREQRVCLPLMHKTAVAAAIIQNLANIIKEKSVCPQ